VWVLPFTRVKGFAPVHREMPMVLPRWNPAGGFQAISKSRQGTTDESTTIGYCPWMPNYKEGVSAIVCPKECYTLDTWAKFQPRAKSPRQDPGQLYYPGAYSHVFEKYWSTVENPLSQAEVNSESEFTQACMSHYLAALNEMDLSSFTPLIDGEAKQSHVSIAQEAAVSRLSPIQDAHDFWSLLEDRRSPVTGSGGSAPDESRTMFRSRWRGSTSLRLLAP
jgi:hypothetical protein